MTHIYSGKDDIYMIKCLSKPWNTYINNLRKSYTLEHELNSATVAISLSNLLKQYSDEIGSQEQHSSTIEPDDLMKRLNAWKQLVGMGLRDAYDITCDDIKQYIKVGDTEALYLSKLGKNEYLSGFYIKITKISKHRFQFWKKDKLQLEMTYYDEVKLQKND